MLLVTGLEASLLYYASCWPTLPKGRTDIADDVVIFSECTLRVSPNA